MTITAIDLRPVLALLGFLAVIAVLMAVAPVAAVATIFIATAGTSVAVVR